LSHTHIAIFALAMTVFCRWAVAQPSPDGYDWAQIGAVGNAPYMGFSDPLSPTFGRGGVNYAYSMSRTEVTTAQWLEFYNAALARPDPLPFVGSGWWGIPVGWGATRDTEYMGPGVRYRLRTDVADAAMLPADGIPWRVAAVLCNWLTNGKDSAALKFMNGAYDVTTFTGNFPTFGDQRQHTPGAHYWIPTLDEYLKASFYDPNGNGSGQSRWWQYPDRSDDPLIYGPPPNFGGDGTGQANAQFSIDGHEYEIPLGAYPNVQSPWGLLDVAGGTSERLEDFWVSSDGRNYRLIDGSCRHFDGGYIDSLLSYGQESPGDHIGQNGFRLASDVPTPGAGFVLLAGTFVALGRRRRSLGSSRA
jgi:hypothetical protein